MNDKDKFDALMPKPKFKAGDRVRWVHRDNRTGTVEDCSSQASHGWLASHGQAKS